MIGWDQMEKDKNLSDKQTKKNTAKKKVLHTTKVRALRLFGNICT